MFYDNKLLYDLVALTTIYGPPTIRKKLFWLDNLRVVGVGEEEPEHKSVCENDCM